MPSEKMRYFKKRPPDLISREEARAFVNNLTPDELSTFLLGEAEWNSILWKLLLIKTAFKKLTEPDGVEKVKWAIDYALDSDFLREEDNRSGCHRIIDLILDQLEYLLAVELKKLVLDLAQYTLKKAEIARDEMHDCFYFDDSVEELRKFYEGKLLDESHP